MRPVSVCILWHMHQPYYPDDLSGECTLPWVRLHGVKDYFGMAALAERFPEVRLTFNLVPSLLEQIEGYLSGRLQDRFQQLTSVPAADLSEEERQELLASFFLVNRATMIEPHPRYAQLFSKRQAARRDGRYHAGRFSTQELLDLQVWFNLCWFHPLAAERWPEIKELIDKGRGYSEEDKARVLQLQMEVLGEVIPLYRRLQERGQVELITSPYFHPILPLLIDRNSARISLPEARTPNPHRRYPEDARWHLHEAVRSHQERFGRPPRGLWPSEGAVSRELVPLVREAGLEWLATDQDILALSVGQSLERDPDGHLRQPDLLYQPYLYQGQGGPLAVLFRDHFLSDLIGFHYHKAPAETAVADLLGRLRQAARCRFRRSPLVVIVLDGENAWEYYPNQGVDFLRLLYERLGSAADLTTVTPSEYLSREPPTATLETLFPGSWINHNFAIWIGHEEDNRAWQALDHTRDFLLRRLAQPPEGVPPEAAQRAWRELYIAQGSDWFWWYGDEHTSGMDDRYDALFRAHLSNAYRLLGEEPPLLLGEPICRACSKPVYSAPKQFLEVRVDGRVSNYFEWLGAGRYHTSNPRGTMASSSRGPIKNLYFGFNDREFLLRIDCYRAAREVLGRFEVVRLVLDGPQPTTLEVSGCGGAEPVARLSRGGEPPRALAEVRLACEVIFELTVPFGALGLEADRVVEFVVEFVEPGGLVMRYPRESAITFRVPTADFEARMWTA